MKLLIVAVFLVVIEGISDRCCNDMCKCDASREQNSLADTAIVNDICHGYMFGTFICGDGKVVYIQAGFCLTHYNSSENLVIVGLCPYFPTDVKWCGSTPPLSIYYAFPARLPLAEVTNYTCGAYNREGVLCSKCKPGYGPAVYAFSLQCAKCGNNSISNWALYFILVLFPITIFYFIIIMFNIRATAPPFTAFILMCQIYCMIEIVYVPYKMRLSGFKDLSVLLQTVRTLCGFWNLDFFRFLVPPFCLSSNLNNLQALSLEYIHAVFPLILIIVTSVCIELHARNFIPFILIWKPFHKCVTRLRRSWDPTASVVNAFSTFLLLNFSRVITVIMYYSNNTKVWISKSELVTLLYSEPSVLQYSKQHLPYIICSCCFMTLFVLVPTLLLCLYPTKIFRRLLGICLSLRLQNALFIFIDTFQGDYKDGTNGTRDFRSASGLHLIILVLMILTNHSSLERYLAIDHAYFLLCIVALFYALARPCKQNYANILHSILIALTAAVIMLIGHVRFQNHIFGFLLVALLCLLTPHVVLCGYIIYKIIKSIRVNYDDCHVKRDEQILACSLTDGARGTQNMPDSHHNDLEHTPLLNKN